MQMRRNALLVIVGGVLAAAAFFLPFFLDNPQAGLFGPGTSLLSAFRQSVLLLIGESVSPFQFIVTVVITLLEPIGAFLLFAGGLLAPKMGRSLYIWGLSGAVLSLTFLLWYFSLLYSVDVAFRPGTSVWELFTYFGLGYWLAIIGCTLGLLGALLGWLNGQASRAALMPSLVGSARGRASLKSVAIALELLGWLLLITGFFLPSFPSNLLQSMFDLLKIPNAYLFIWPDLLALVLLPVGVVFAFLGRKGGHLASLNAALVGLVLVLLLLSRLLPGLGGALLGGNVGIAFWVTAAGCLLGLVGAALGLWEHPAAPVAAEMLETPLPS